MSEVFTSLGIINPVTLAFALDLILAVVLGYVIGAERELRGKDAGISTHIFVICGAMVYTFLSMMVDPTSESRIAAQIVSGIGFLGAGLILKEGASVKNLTTAASIWFAGAIGMAIGFEYYGVAILSGIVSVFIPRIPRVKWGANTKEIKNAAVLEQREVFRREDYRSDEGL